MLTVPRYKKERYKKENAWRHAIVVAISFPVCAVFSAPAIAMGRADGADPSADAKKTSPLIAEVPIKEESIKEEPVKPGNSSSSAATPATASQSVTTAADNTMVVDEIVGADAVIETPSDDGINSVDLDADPDALAQTESPFRVSVAYEFGYKTRHPDRVIRNRASLRLEYAKTFNGNLSAQFDAKANLFLGQDHRREAADNDITVNQAYLQTSFGETSLRAGQQTLAWGESLIGQVTDDVSPRDNRELFNFNLEELRIGQPMLVVDRYAKDIRWTAFWNPRPSFDKSPARGTLYDFDPLIYRPRIEGDSGSEYGASWKRSFANADISLMAASLIDNAYARRLNADGSASRVRQRFTMLGVSFTRALGDVVIRGEAAQKVGKPFNDAQFQIVRRRTLQTYVGIDYQRSSTLSFSMELLNQHVYGWDRTMPGTDRDQQTAMFSVQKRFHNDDVTVSIQNFGFWPNPSWLSILSASWRVDDHLTLSMNLAVPETKRRDGTLRAVRDQNQALFKVQWQF